jgi:penicillin-binding protein 1C
LRRLTSRRADAVAPAAADDRLTLVFPPAGALLPRPETDGVDSFTLRAAGGRRPLAWLVDGKPLAAPAHRRDTRWTPDGQGFFQITVIDSEGATATASVRIR